MEASRQQREAIAAIRKLGGVVSYDYYGGRFDCEFSLAAGRTVPVVTAGPPGPAWARKLLGDDFFADVVDMDYGPPGMYGPVGLGNLGWESTPITDAWLEHIGKLAASRRWIFRGPRCRTLAWRRWGG